MVYNDDSANNTYWVSCSAIPESGFPGFSNVKANLMEKKLLAFLD